MKRGRRRRWTLLGAVLLAPVAVACGDDAADTPEPRPSRDAAVVADAADAAEFADAADVGDAAEPSDDAGRDGSSGATPRCATAAEFTWNLPPWMREPVVPDDNPMSTFKVELGRHLFYDLRLSANETQSCASCHRQELAFTDGRAQAVGSTGQVHPRSAMSLVNAAYPTSLNWADPTLRQLEVQALIPLLGEEPVELGLRGKEALLLERLRADRRYAVLFPCAFPGEPDPFTIESVARALAAFQRTLMSYRSPYDRFAFAGEREAISESARRGAELFVSERLECFHCHHGFNLQDSTNYVGRPLLVLRFHNTGLYNLGGTGAYPEPNTGVAAVTGLPEDMGRFRVPTLRNVAVTAPYMHDGSVATLDEVLDHYGAGGRTIETGPNAGVGRDNPYKSSFLFGFELNSQERTDILEFLETLTDAALLSDPTLSDPWPLPCALCEARAGD